MKGLNLCGAVLATFSMTAMADAGLMGMMKGGGLPNLPGMGPVKGFRQAPQNQQLGQQAKKDGKKNPFGKKYF